MKQDYSLLFGPLLVCFLFFTIYSTVLKRQMVTRFAIGDCFTDNGIRESWEKPSPIWKVDMVGVESYKVSIWLDDRWYTNSAATLHFGTGLIWHKIECPLEAK